VGRCHGFVDCSALVDRVYPNNFEVNIFYWIDPFAGCSDRKSIGEESSLALYLGIKNALLPTQCVSFSKDWR